MADLERELEDIELKSLIASALDRGIILAGRTFVRAKTLTFEHFNHRVNAVRDSGVVQLIRQYKAESDDSDILAAAVMAQAMESGELFRLMSVLLVEKDVPWTVKTGKENAIYFANLTDVSIFQELEQIVLWLLLDFFHNGVASKTTTLKYLFAERRPTKLPFNAATPTSEILAALFPQSQPRAAPPQ